ncbi:MAG: phosphatase PAP2 family protein, partial [Leptospiraceae bacterium]|nr:phosphatase PAP2 family protein [Leptospiraceae bacterium]
MRYKTLLDNNILFGNGFLESIPHPEGILGEFFKAISVFCHYSGGITFFIFLLPFVYICYSRNLGIKLGVAILSTGILNGLAKFYFESPRPSGLSNSFTQLLKSAEEKSFGFPSGHSHVAILIWGIFFLHFKNKFLKGFSLFMIFSVPLSRMYVGVHYPGDVIGGLLMGFISLILIEWIFKLSPDFPSLKEMDSKKLISLIRSISLALIAITLPVTLVSSHANNEIHSQSLNSVIAASGSLAGFFSGILFLKYKFGENYF